MKKLNRLRLTAGAAVLATAAVPSVGAIAGTGGHHGHVARRNHRQSAAAYARRSSTTLASGVHLDRYLSHPGGKPVISDVLTATLGSNGVSAGILCGAVTQTASVKGWARGSRAVAAVNGDYFDITASQAPNGTIIRGGHILKGTRSGQSVTGQGRDGVLRIGTVYLRNTLRWGRGNSQAVDFYNTVLSRNILPRNGFAVLDGSWGAAPLRLPNAPRDIAIIAVGANHKVLSTSRKVTGHQRVPRGGMLIIATGHDASLGRLRRGSKITESVGMRTSAPTPFTWGLGYGLTLMRDDRVIHNWPNDSDPRDARTALGWKDGGRTMLLVTVEYGKGSYGEEVNQIADELAAQGATDGVLLDGGGSTTLVASPKSRGVKQIGPVATPGNVERKVPIGIGIFVTHHRG